MNALSRLPADALQRSEEGAKRKLIYSFYSFVCPLDLIHWLRLALGAEIARALAQWTRLRLCALCSDQATSSALGRVQFEPSCELRARVDRIDKMIFAPKLKLRML